MSAYCLFDNIEVTDPVTLERYKARVAPIVERYGGRYVVLGGRVDRVEGSWQPTYPVMLEFPTMAQARGWYDSQEYRELKAMRHAAVRSIGVIIEGV